MMSSSGKRGFQPRHQLEAVQIGHPDIDNRQVRNELGGDGQTASFDERVPSTWWVVAQNPLDGAKHARLVVHDENA